MGRDSKGIAVDKEKRFREGLVHDVGSVRLFVNPGTTSGPTAPGHGQQDAKNTGKEVGLSCVIGRN